MSAHASNIRLALSGTRGVLMKPDNKKKQRLSLPSSTRVPVNNSGDGDGDDLCLALTYKVHRTYL